MCKAREPESHSLPKSGMATYLIAGANRGLGLEFARQLSPQRRHENHRNGPRCREAADLARLVHDVIPWRPRGPKPVPPLRLGGGDSLVREPDRVDLARVGAFIAGRAMLVTGAAGPDRLRALPSGRGPGTGARHPPSTATRTASSRSRRRPRLAIPTCVSSRLG